MEREINIQIATPNSIETPDTNLQAPEKLQAPNIKVQRNFNPKGIAVLKPRFARDELPWASLRNPLGFIRGYFLADACVLRVVRYSTKSTNSWAVMVCWRPDGMIEVLSWVRVAMSLFL